MPVNLRGPHDLGLQMSQNVLLDSQLDHLRSLANRTAPDWLGAADLEELSTTISASWDHSQVTLIHLQS